MISGILLIPAMAMSQQDTVIILVPIEVTAERIDLTDIGKHTDKLDSLTLASRHYDNLADMLSRNTPLYVRSYGAGTLATLGIRGGNSTHTQILWNGIPLRNPMLGLLDLALLPASFIDEAAVHYGGHGAAFGSGAVGGLISLANDPIRQNDKINIGVAIGSWGMREGNLRMDYGFKKFRFSSRVFTQAAENNYQYRLSKDAEERHQVHNHVENLGLLQELAWLPSKDQQIISRIWYQYADRQIPPTTTQTTSKAAQQDNNIRASLQWNLQKEKTKWQIKTAWLDERIDYQDTLILLYTTNRFRTWLAEGSVSRHFGQHLHVAGGIYAEIANADSKNYEGYTKRNQNAAFITAGYTLGDWYWRLQFREENTAGDWSPLLFDLAGEYNLRRFAIKASVSRNYRTPTLNDLNWRPGGNPSLVPEEGLTVEGGIYYKLKNKTHSIDASATAYTRQIDEWIMWMPPVKDGNNFWSPLNIASVRSRGVETRLKGGLEKANWIFEFHSGLDLTWSTFEEPLREFAIDAGEQLFYVPVENLSGGATIRYKKFQVFYQHRWFGSATGINDQIAPSNIGSGGSSIGFEVLRLKGLLYLQVENIWDTPYRIIERRPMPGRSFTGGVKFQFD
ncbi:MAG: TonB-dependent receptor plug domain-containing protein [Bacteroidota bacterium]|nr:TonB-dependent receptor plug domain-containing protein [Bacteroidota bacterium]